jgi:protein O-GlcNAc transferase
LLYRMKDWVGAEAVARRWVRLAPSDLDAQEQLAWALVRTGEHDESLATFRRILEREPKRASAQHGLAVALHGAGKLDESLAAFEAAVRLAGRQATAELWEDYASALEAAGKSFLSGMASAHAKDLRAVRQGR